MQTPDMPALVAGTMNQKGAQPPNHQGGAVGMSIQQDIERLDHGIRLLKVQYDQYFAGVLNLPPFELRAEVEQLIKAYAHASFDKPIQRFHFNSLVSRFNSFSELWAKCLRLKEEGRALPGYPGVAIRGGMAAEGAASAGATENPGRNGNGRPGPTLQTIVGGPGWDSERLRPLYRHYVEVLESQGKDPGALSFPGFARQIVQKTEAVKSRSACDAVRLRLTVEGERILLKAQPLRRRKKTS
jgi:hypothetical protein